MGSISSAAIKQITRIQSSSFPSDSCNLLVCFLFLDHSGIQQQSKLPHIPLSCLLLFYFYFFSICDLLCLDFYFQEKVRTELRAFSDNPCSYSDQIHLSFTWVKQHCVALPHHPAELYTIAWRTRIKQKIKQDIVAYFIAMGSGSC